MEHELFGQQFILANIFTEELSDPNDVVTKNALLEIAQRNGGSGYDLVIIHQTNFFLIFDNPMGLVVVGQAHSADTKWVLQSLNNLCDENMNVYSAYRIIHSDLEIFESPLTPINELNNDIYAYAGYILSIGIRQNHNVDLKEGYKFEDFIQIITLLSQGNNSPN